MFMMTQPRQAADTVTLQGPLDAVSIAANRSLGDEIANINEDCITLDMGKVSFIDASGLGFLSFLFKRLNETGRALKLTNMQGQPYAFLNDLGVADVFDMEMADGTDRWSEMTPATPMNAAV